MDLADLRSRRLSAGKRPNRSLRAELIAAAHQLYAQGESMASIGELLGLCAQTVSRYLDAKPEAALAVPDHVAFAEVIVEHALASGRSMTTPSGVRFEGLSLEDVVALAQALS